MKIVWVIILVNLNLISFSQVLDKTEVFQLVTPGAQEIPTLELRLLTKEKGEENFKFLRKVKASYYKGDNSFYNLTISKDLFFEKKFCSNGERTCYIEYKVGNSVFNCQVVVGYKGPQAEFFLIQWGLFPKQLDRNLSNGNRPIIQPIYSEDNKIWCFELTDRLEGENRYSLKELDMNQSSQKTIKILKTIGDSTINYYKIVDNQLIFGGIDGCGKHWYDQYALK